MKSTKKLESLHSNANLFDSKKLSKTNSLATITGGNSGPCTVTTTWWIFPDGFGDKHKKSL